MQPPLPGVATQLGTVSTAPERREPPRLPKAAAEQEVRSFNRLNLGPRAA